MLESKIKKVLRSLITEEDVTETQVIFTPDEYVELLPYFGWSGVAVANMKQYRGKEIVINGKLDFQPS